MSSTTDNVWPSTNLPETEFWAHTKSSTFKLKFNWTIDNFSFYLEDDPTQFISINSPKYSASGHEDVPFYLGLYPNNRKKEEIDHLALFLYCSNPKFPVIAKYKMSIVDREGKDRHSRNNQRKFIDNTGYGYPKLVARSVLLDPAYGLLPNDQLTIRCEVIICFKLDDSSVISEMITTQPLGANSREYEDELSSSMALLLANCKYGDVTLSVDGIELSAHKDILSVRSPVFDAMFSHQDTKEAQEGKVKIEDVSAEVFQDLLRFIYSGKVPAEERLTTELLAASDKYQVESLKSACESHLSTSLSIETAASVLLIADMHKADKLKTNAIKFIAANLLKVVFTDAWINLTNVRPELMREINRTTVTQEESIESDEAASTVKA